MEKNSQKPGDKSGNPKDNPIRLDGSQSGTDPKNDGTTPSISPTNTTHPITISSDNGTGEEQKIEPVEAKPPTETEEQILQTDENTVDVEGDKEKGDMESESGSEADDWDMDQYEAADDEADDEYHIEEWAPTQSRSG